MEESNNYKTTSYGLPYLVVGLLAFSPALQANDFNDSRENTAGMLRQVIPTVNFAANNKFVFNPKSLTWYAINSNGKVIRTGRASGGRHYCPDVKRSCRTPSGTYSVISKLGANCRSSRYPVGKGGAPMPYCMFFSRYYAIHGSYDVPNYNASHGCIRVRPADARWLNQNFIKIGTTVVVKPY